MSDLNIGQTSNFYNTNYASNAAKSTDGVKYSQPSQTTTTNMQTSSQNIVNPNSSQQTNYVQAQLAQMTGTDTSALLKDLLNLPQDIKDFLLLMSTQIGAKTASEQELATLLINSNLDLTSLMQLIQQNGKDALSKLFQMVANFNQIGTSMKTAQQNEIAAILNACVSSAGTSQTQALKTLMLLYLPWLPLGEQNAFNIEIGSNGGQDGANSDDSITILISTINFGNVQITLFKQPQKAIAMQIVCSNEFPKEEIQKRLKNESENYNIQTGIAFEEKSNFSKKSVKNLSTQVSMNTSPGVNPFLILMAFSVIKIVIEMDKKGSLSENRREVMEKTEKN